MNKIFLTGRLVADPELKYTNSGTPVTNFTLAVDRPFKKDSEKEADFIDIVAWRKLAEIVAQNLSKGRKIALEGKLETRIYEGKDSKKHKVTEVNADSIEFLDKPKKEEGEEEAGF